MRIVPESTRSAHAVLRAVRACLSEIPEGLVLVACSGGGDSLALAAALADVTRQTGRPAGAIIVDHGLQPDSAQIAGRAAQQCREMGLPLVNVVTADVGVGSGPEAAARSARYQALDAQSDSLGAVAVLLGHSLDDQAETVLLKMSRGSGTRALAGMAAHRGRYRRPLLGLRRATMALACEHWALTAWQDPHNQDQRYRRVRVRNTVLPQFEQEIGPGIVPALARTAALTRADADALDSLALTHWESERAEGRSGVSVALLSGLPQALRTRVVRLWLLEARRGSVDDGQNTATHARNAEPTSRAFTPTDLTADHLLSIDRLVTDWRGQGALVLPGGLAVRRVRGRLQLVMADANRGAASQRPAAHSPRQSPTQSEPTTREASDGR